MARAPSLVFHCLFIDVFGLVVLGSLLFFVCVMALVPELCTKVPASAPSVRKGVNARTAQVQAHGLGVFLISCLLCDLCCCLCFAFSVVSLPSVS